MNIFGKAILAVMVIVGFGFTAQASNSLGSIQESVVAGHSITVGLNPSSTGNWFILSPASSFVDAQVQNGVLVVRSLQAGTAVINVCTDQQGTNCFVATITVIGSAVSAPANQSSSSVLGATTVAAHPVGSWIINNGTVFYVHATGIIPVSTWQIFMKNGGTQNKIQVMNEGDFHLPMLSIMTFPDSRLQ